MKERYAVAFFLNLNVIVIYSAVEALKLVKLVIVRGEDRPRIKDIRVDYVFDNSPRDRKAVVCAGASSYFVQEQEALARCILKDIGHFPHLDHEC